MTNTPITDAERLAQVVKPLAWENFEGRGAKANAMLLCNYLIDRWSDGRFEVSVSSPGYGTGFDGERWHDSLELAKAAAQADYERRILSAIDLDAIRAEARAEALREAAGVVWSMSEREDLADAVLALIDTPADPVREAARVLVQSLEGSPDDRVEEMKQWSQALCAAIVASRADLEPDAWLTADEVMGVISTALRALAGND